MGRLFGAFLTLLLLPSLFFLYKFLPYYLLTRSAGKPTQLLLDPSNTAANSSKRLMYLQELTALPVVGQFFDEERIFQLVRLNRFQEAIQSSQKAIQTSISARSPHLWYYRALSQCILKKFDDCEASLSQATLYTNQHTETMLQAVYSLLEELTAIEQQKVASDKTTLDGLTTAEGGRRMEDFSEL